MKPLYIFLVLLLIRASSWSQDPFITTWRTTTANDNIVIPTFLGEIYNYDVDWGDGSTSTGQTGNSTHIYTMQGDYTVSISGVFPNLYIGDPIFDHPNTNRYKIRSIDQWRGQSLTSMAKAFFKCEYLTGQASDIPDLSIFQQVIALIHFNTKRIKRSHYFTRISKDRLSVITR